MTRRKQHRFVHNAASEHVIENGKPLYKTIKGKWQENYFKNANPIVVELACGKGEYTIGLAQAYPNLNFIGIDIKGDRIARGSMKAQESALQNVAFLRTDITYLEEFFLENEISEIWLTFPDPQPRPKQEKHRLTHPRFLRLYKRVLQPDGLFHLKTDNPEFFTYSLEQIRENGFVNLEFTTDLYASPLNAIHLTIETTYERMFFDKGFTINYLQCKNAQD